MKYYDKNSSKVKREGVKKKFLFAVGIFGVAIVAASFNFAGNKVSATVPGNNILVSKNTSGVGGGNLDSYSSGISANGKTIAFGSSASDLVTGDYNSKGDVFVRNLTNNTTTRVSVSSSGVESDGPSSFNDLSETGRYVLFRSQATNLISGRTLSNAIPQVYVRDTKNNTTTLVSQNTSGAEADGYAFGLDISSDGRFVLMTSTATNLGPTVTTSNRYNLYLLDRETGGFTLVNAPLTGSMANVDTNNAHMNCDGAFVVFESYASNLTSTSTTHADVYLFDRRAGDKLTNLTAGANSAALRAEISCNGNYIGFASKATNLDTNLTDTSMNEFHGYVYDRVDESFHVIDQTTANTTASTGMFYGLYGILNLKISDMGVAIFTSNDTSLAGNSSGNLYVRNINTGVTELLSQTSGGGDANNVSSDLAITPDGSLASYKTHATNLVSGDTNGYPDVFRSETGY